MQRDAQTEDLQEVWLRSSSQDCQAKPSVHLGKDTLPWRPSCGDLVDTTGHGQSPNTSWVLSP